MSVLESAAGGQERAECREPLAWGRHYLMCPPTHFRVAYAINPWMSADTQPDPDLAHAQWETLAATLRTAGARVDTIEQPPDLPDMVFAMNLAIVDGSRAVVGRFRYAERRPEADLARRWLTERGFEVLDVDADEERRFEPGDAFLYGDVLLANHGFRSDAGAWDAVGRAFGVRVLHVRSVDPRMYHLDLSFCPLDDRRAIVAPDAWDDAGCQAVRSLVPEPLVLDLDEAMTFCANSVVVGTTVVMPACPPRVGRILERWGFDVVVVDVGEFLKAGGAVRCMTNPLDLSLADARVRRLTAVPEPR